MASCFHSARSAEERDRLGACAGKSVFMLSFGMWIFKRDDCYSRTNYISYHIVVSLWGRLVHCLSSAEPNTSAECGPISKVLKNTAKRNSYYGSQLETYPS